MAPMMTEYLDKEPMAANPKHPVRSLAELAALALRIEEATVICYQGFAADMIRQGRVDLAAVFRQLENEERQHVAVMRGWMALVNDTEAPAPTALAASTTASAPAVLDPEQPRPATAYQIFTQAVWREERAFAYYAYIAANTPVADVQRHAEELAKEELRHAALLRRERRKAFHAERAAAFALEPAPSYAVALALFRPLADDCRRLFLALEAANDRVSAHLLREMANEAHVIGQSPDAGSVAPVLDLAPLQETPGRLLHQAAGLLEQAFDRLQGYADHADEETVLGDILTVSEHVVRWLALINRRLGDVEP